MSTLRVNSVYLNDAGNATVSIANSWNVAVVSGGQTRLHVNYDGNIGMGTTAPSYRVHMVTSGNSAYVASADGTGTTLSGVNGAGLGVYGTFSATDTAIFSNSQERMRVSSTGNIGIGTSSPSYKLDVNGTINTSNILINGAAFSSTITTIPTGAVINYASTTAPTGGYLACDGSIYSRSTYPELANVIGSPPMLSSFTAEYANNDSNFSPTVFASANGVLFFSAGSSFTTSLYTSTDGTTFTSRTASPMSNNYNRNFSVVANVSGGIWVISNASSSFAGTTTPTCFQSSTNLTTWTNRSIALSGQTGTGAGVIYSDLNGIAGGGTSNRLVALFTKQSYQTAGCCITITSGYIANTAVSSDGGATWSYANNVPVANSTTVQSQIAASNGGFVVARANLAYWSANGQYWQDITANLCSAIGVSTGLAANGTTLFYNMFKANNQFIIPAYGNKFIVTSPSGNGANGNWSTITPEGLSITNPLLTAGGQAASGLAPLVNQFSSYSSSRILHNGQCFVLYFSGQLYFSQDLKYWFRKTDLNYTQTNANPQQHIATIGNKFIHYMDNSNTIVSFTSTGAYTAATQFPVPKYASVASHMFNIDGVPAIPSVTYIKT